MAVATSTLIAIGISAAASAYSAKKASSANKEAAKTSADASDKALDVQKEMYDQTRTDNQSYRQIGNGALSQLGYGLGIDLTPPKAAPIATPATPVAPVPGDAGHGGGIGGAVKTVGGGAVNAIKDVGGGALRFLHLPGAPDKRQEAPPPVATAPAAQTASGYVQMRSPSGQVGRVPVAQVSAAQAAGGTVIS